MISRIDVRSFRWVPSLGVSTQLQQWWQAQAISTNIAKKAVQLAYLNIALWHGGGISSSVSVWSLQGSVSDQALQLTKYLKETRVADIVHLQQQAGTGDVVSIKIQEATTLLQQATTLTPSLQADIFEYERQIWRCSDQKQQAEDRYNMALQAYNASSVEQATQQAQDANRCIAEHSVALKSTQWVLANLEIEIKKTQHYVSILTSNKDLLLRYADVVHTDIPQQLLQLKREIDKL